MQLAAAKEEAAAAAQRIEKVEQQVWLGFPISSWATACMGRALCRDPQVCSAKSYQQKCQRMTVPGHCTLTSRACSSFAGRHSRHSTDLSPHSGRSRGSERNAAAAKSAEALFRVLHRRMKKSRRRLICWNAPRPLPRPSARRCGRLHRTCSARLHCPGHVNCLHPLSSSVTWKSSI